MWPRCCNAASSAVHCTKVSSIYVYATARCLCLVCNLHTLDVTLVQIVAETNCNVLVSTDPLAAVSGIVLYQGQRVKVLVADCRVHSTHDLPAAVRQWFCFTCAAAAVRTDTGLFWASPVLNGLCKCVWQWRHLCNAKAA